MNRIHNDISDSIPDDVSAFRWRVHRAQYNNRKVMLDIPTPPISANPRAKTIWEHYFKLIYQDYKLAEKLKANKDSLKTEVPGLYDRIFPNNQFDKTALLEMLILPPQKYACIDLGRKRINGKPDTPVLCEVFDYDNIAKREAFGELVFLLDVNTCPYCGRAFTNTVKRKDLSSSKRQFIRTNQVDHYYPKALYPHLALSIYNWIPSCGSCNQRKSDNDKQFLYPYVEEMGDAYQFRTHVVDGVDYLMGKNGSEDDFFMSLDQIETTSSTAPGFCGRAEEEIAKLGINELYESHKGYVCNLFRQRFVFGDAYIDSLISSFPELFKTREDVWGMIHAKSIQPEQIGSCPLDKLTKDINEEIDFLLQASKMSLA